MKLNIVHSNGVTRSPIAYLFQDLIAGILPKFFLLLCITLGVGSECSVFAQKGNISWTLETENAAWRPRDSQGEFVFRNQLWIMGGWFTARDPNPRDVWKSADGKNWTRVIEQAPWEYSDLPGSVVFKNRMWMLGGRKVPGTDCSNEVWATQDGVKWELVNPSAPWRKRLGAAAVVFKNRIWIMGGTDDFYQNNDSTLMNDVWSSADGMHWKLETNEAPWSKRVHFQAVVFKGKIWVMAGGMRAPTAQTKNDVWCSEDGVNWQLVTESAPWRPRLWYSTVVYRNRMWVLGGWTSEKDGNCGDVWYSEDGKNWTEFKSAISWSKRHEHAAFVFQDKIWVAGGATGDRHELDSQVWSLEIPKNWFKKTIRAPK